MAPTSQNPEGQVTWARDSTVSGGKGVPILMMYGSEDDAIVDNDDDEDDQQHRAWVSYEQWHINDGKAFLVLEGLDHNGMTDQRIMDDANTVASTLTAETRAAMVVESLTVWLDAVLPRTSPSDEYLDDFCPDVVKAVGKENINVCLVGDATLPPDSSDDGSEDSSDDFYEKRAFQIGVPVGIVGALVILCLLFCLRRCVSPRNRASVSHHGSSPPPTGKDAAVKGDKAPGRVDEEQGVISKMTTTK